MTIRERLEREEHERLAPWAAFADQSAGRLRQEEPCRMRTCFQRDIDRIAYSKSYRRLMHKTQVFLQPEGDHYRTRMTHTLEVCRIARSIARALRLNEDLTEAAALGHDLGHTPFGHVGETALSEMTGQPFHHNEQSLRIVDRLENDGNGLNLTYEVRMALIGHTGPKIPETLEGRIVRLSDRIAYINHDIDDAMRAGILSNDDIPPAIASVLGHTHRERINTLVLDVIACSQGGAQLLQSPQIERAMNELREFMFERVYRNPVAKSEESKAKMIIQQLYRYYAEHPDKLPESSRQQLQNERLPRVICDYIAGMTDKYAVHIFSQIYIPTAWQIR